MARYLNTLFKYWTFQVFAPGTIIREKYEAFKRLLEMDQRAHELMADLEEVLYRKRRVDHAYIEETYQQLSHAVSAMVDNINKLSPLEYVNLQDYFKKIDFYIRFILSPNQFTLAPPFAIPLDRLPEDSQNLAGGKGGNLSTLAKRLGLPIPPGFVITTSAFYYFLECNDLKTRIQKLLAGLDISSPASLEATSREITGLIKDSPIPRDIEYEIMSTFYDLWAERPDDVRLAVRSSAVAEDTESSFAGQYLTLLNVGRGDLLHAYKEVLASKYLPTALCYRIHYGLSDLETPMAVVVLETVDAVSSGVVYTMDPESGRDDTAVVSSVWGMGELLVGGEASPDVIRLKKTRPPEVISVHTGEKPVKMVCPTEGPPEILPVQEGLRNTCSIEEKAALKLASWAMDIEDHYGYPQDVEWCQDRSGKIFVLQARPLKVRDKDVFTGFDPGEIPNKVLFTGGQTASPGIGYGKIFLVERVSDLEKVPEGSVLVARDAAPYFIAVMDRVSAIVTDLGSSESHLASVAREFGIPLLVNTEHATEKLLKGQEVTVHAEGHTVYEGKAESLLQAAKAQKKDPFEQSPIMTRLRSIMSFITPLRLLDPSSPRFVSEECRSLHDIIRFVHEKAISEMFSLGGKRGGGSVRGAKKLVTDLPILFYVLDVGGGLSPEARGKKEISIDDVYCRPMHAIWKGLTDPSIKWSEFEHFAWDEYDSIVLGGGIISKESPALASYAVISEDYLNLNIRFGYHFVIVDTICKEDLQGNHIMFRFNGGGGDLRGRLLRIEYLKEILERLGFTVETKGDLVDARLHGLTKPSICEKLKWIGKLLGVTRLMDMYLKDQDQVRELAQEFLRGEAPITSAA